MHDITLKLTDPIKYLNKKSKNIDMSKVIFIVKHYGFILLCIQSFNLEVYKPRLLEDTFFQTLSTSFQTLYTNLKLARKLQVLLNTSTL